MIKLKVLVTSEIMLCFEEYSVCDILFNCFSNIHFVSETGTLCFYNISDNPMLKKMLIFLLQAWFQWLFLHKQSDVMFCSFS